MENDKTLSVSVQVMMSRADRKKIEEAAERDNRSISNWCRPILVNAAILSKPVRRK